MVIVYQLPHYPFHLIENFYIKMFFTNALFIHLLLITRFEMATILDRVLNPVTRPGKLSGEDWWR